MMKVGVTTVTFRKQPFREVPELLKQSCIDGVEWCACAEHFSVDDRETLDAIKEYCTEQKLDIFSLATYCNLSQPEEFAGIVSAAEVIGAKVIRIWAGQKCRKDFSDKEYAQICVRAKEFCDCAKEKNVRIALEFHPNTLTNTAAEAIEFVKDVGSDNLYLYWQINESLSHEENINELKMVLPYLCGNIHMHNYHLNERAYFPLSEIQSEIMDYLHILQKQKKEYNLIIEFVCDHLPENFMKDALFLRECIDSISGEIL